jgi:hypothetical protein
VTLHEYEELLNKGLTYGDLQPGDVFFFDDKDFVQSEAFIILDKEGFVNGRNFECKRLFGLQIASGGHTNNTKVKVGKAI